MATKGYIYITYSKGFKSNGVCSKQVLVSLYVDVRQIMSKHQTQITWLWKDTKTNLSENGSSQMM